MHRYGIFVLFACSLIAYFLNINKTDIYILDEVKNATCAKEMFYDGNNLVPTFNGELRTDKPPLHYFFMKVGYLIFGYNELGARFFSAVAGILLVFLLFYYTGIMLGKKVAWFSSLIFLSSTFATIQFRLAVPDPYLIVLLFLALIHLYLFIEHKKNVMWFYFFAALAFLAKGLIAIILPGLIFIVYLFLAKSFSFKNLFSVLNWRGVLLFILIVCPWFVYVGMETDWLWIKGFFLDHHLQRFIETREGHNGFPGLAVLYAVMALMPFGFWLIPALMKKKTYWLRNRFLLFALVSSGVIILFFTFSRTLLPSYIAPSIPFLSILLGNWLKTKQLVKTKFSSRIALALFVLLSLALPVALYLSVLQEIPDYQNHFLILGISLLLPVGAFIALYHYLNQKKLSLIYSVFICWFVFNTTLHLFIIPEVINSNSVKIAVHSIEELEQNDLKKINLIAYKKFNPAFVWYLKSSLKVEQDSMNIKSYSSERNRLLIITSSSVESELAENDKLKKLFIKKDLFENSEVVIFEWIK